MFLTSFDQGDISFDSLSDLSHKYTHVELELGCDNIYCKLLLTHRHWQYTAMAKNIPGNFREKCSPAFSPWIKYYLHTSYRHSIAYPVEKIETTSEKFTQRDIRRRKLHNITTLLPPKHTPNKNTSVTEKLGFLKGSATDPIGLGQAGTRIYGTSVQKIRTPV